ncbi:hypothetical protein K2Q00_00350 [Patescibacteria group bacterium]|nr:hypothetical protein [Patescibacteria group bacterium]
MPVPIPFLGEKSLRAKREEMAFKWLAIGLSLLVAIIFHFMVAQHSPLDDVLIYFFMMTLCYFGRVLLEEHLKRRGHFCADVAILLNRRLNLWFSWHLPA